VRKPQAIHALARFARLVSENTVNADALQLLADTLVELADCHGAAVFHVTADRMGLVASRNSPEGLRSWRGAAGEIDSTLERVLRNECSGGIVRTKTLPLVRGGGLFGAVVLFWRKPDDGSEPWLDDVALGLADLAATVLATSAHAQELAQANEEIRKSHLILVRTEKLRALGQMVAGVSHDLRNLLNPLSLHLDVARRANAKGHRKEVDGELREMNDVLARGVEVLERFRNFSRQTPIARLATVDLNPLVHEAVMLAKPRLASAGDRLCRVREVYGAPPPVQGEPGEIVSAVLNLLSNAADAMTKGGELITVGTGERDGGGWITVKDEGPGMSMEVQEHVFEPFFTTKGDQGTGLGLAMVREAVRLHGGTVDLHSEPGHGATFTLWFPPAA
jgi:signal transduction histidine kinase